MPLCVPEPETAKPVPFYLAARGFSEFSRETGRTKYKFLRLNILIQYPQSGFFFILRARPKVNISNIFSDKIFVNFISGTNFLIFFGIQ